MSQKNLKHAALMLLFVFINLSFAMGEKVFKLARGIGVGTLPACGLYLAHNSNKVLQDFSEKGDSITDESLQKWFKEEKEQLNIPNAESVLLVNNVPWHSWMYKKNSYVSLSDKDASVLSTALIDQARAEKNLQEISKKLKCLRREKANRGYIDSFLWSISDGQKLEDQLIRSFESFNKLNDLLIDQHKRTIARDSMILKHELGHIVHKDSQQNISKMVAIPIAVEAVSFGITKSSRKLFNMQQQPKTFLKTTLRSSSAVGAIVPKAIVGLTSTIFLQRQQEARADRFACEHAASRLELEEFAKFCEKLENSEWASESRMAVRFLEATKDPIHPAPVDRKEKIESYLPKWDREHPGDQKRS